MIFGILGLSAITLLLAAVTRAESVTVIKAADRHLPDTDDRADGCCRWRCELAYCAEPSEQKATLEQLVGQVDSEADCLFLDSLGNDCQTLTSDIRTGNLVTYSSVANQVFCPEGNTLTQAFYTIWRSTNWGMNLETYTIDWDVHPGKVRIAGGLCSLEQTGLSCKKGTKSGDCAARSVCTPADLKVTLKAQ